MAVHWKYRRRNRSRELASAREVTSNAGKPSIWKSFGSEWSMSSRVTVCPGGHMLAKQVHTQKPQPATVDFRLGQLRP